MRIGLRVFLIYGALGLITEVMSLKSQCESKKNFAYLIFLISSFNFSFFRLTSWFFSKNFYHVITISWPWSQVLQINSGWLILIIQITCLSCYLEFSQADSFCPFFCSIPYLKRFFFSSYNDFLKYIYIYIYIYIYKSLLLLSIFHRLIKIKPTY